MRGPKGSKPQRKEKKMKTTEENKTTYTFNTEAEYEIFCIEHSNLNIRKLEEFEGTEQGLKIEATAEGWHIYSKEMTGGINLDDSFLK